MSYRYIVVLVLLAVVGTMAGAQPLLQPYAWSLGEMLELDGANLGARTPEVAGARGRVKLDANGHLVLGDGTRVRLVGTSLQWGSQFHDSATAVRFARRIAALGFNCVRFTAFDVAVWNEGSVLAPGTATTGELSATQMQKLDWLVYQLKQNGVYTVFTFHCGWSPRPDDGIRQADSMPVATTATAPLMFDKDVQRIHRRIVRAVLQHTNMYTGTSYAQEPALAYIIGAENASFINLWVNTHDIVRPNYSWVAATGLGSQHVALIDSLWYEYLKGKGYATDAALRAAWRGEPIVNAAQRLRNPGFEELESPTGGAWSFYAYGPAQAQMLYSDGEKHEGEFCARVRVTKASPTGTDYLVAVYQGLPDIRRHAYYRMSFWAKTSAARGTRDMVVSVYNGGAPNNVYGLQERLVLGAEWKKFEYTFSSTATDPATGLVAFWMGADSGDVFLDDVQFREVQRDPLLAGESITKRNITRSMFYDLTYAPKRQMDEADFYQLHMRSMYAGLRAMVRDTVGSEVLMCPTTLMYSMFDANAARDYDIFMNPEWRGDTLPLSKERYGATLSGHSQMKFKGKAFIPMSQIAYPQRYSSEAAVITPAYVGLQDWDGVFFGSYSGIPQAGTNVVDSNSYWEIVNKASMLAMVPSMSAALQAQSVRPSTRVVLVENDTEAVRMPQLHAGQPYSLSTGADSRLPLYRRVETSFDLSGEESLMPQLAVSLFADAIDESRMDAENGQIFRNATDGVFRVITDRYMVASGALASRIVNWDGLLLEQTTAGRHASVSLVSLTDDPILQSSRSLLTIATPSMNQDATADGSVWGKGPIVMEGATFRLTVTAAGFDSLRIVPLSAEARPLPNRSWAVAKQPSGKFSVSINTADMATPWYHMELVGTQTSVACAAGSSSVTVVPNPAAGGRCVVQHPADASWLYVVDVVGKPVMSVRAQGERTPLDTTGLASGVYSVRVHMGNSAHMCRLVVP